MKAPTLIMLLVFILAQQGSGQDTLDMARTLTFYNVPLTWYDQNPRLRFGLEYHDDNHLGYSLEIGFGNRHLNHKRLEDLVWGQAYSFFEVRSEVKWYRQEARQFATYFGLEVFYYNMTDHLTNNSYYPDRNAEELLYDEADFRKEKIAFQFKAGIKFLATRRFVMDFYQGIGLAYRNIRYSNVVNPRLDESDDFEEWGWPASYKNGGKYLLLQFSPGVRIGMVIGRL
jgi:hypothetical protein